MKYQLFAMIMALICFGSRANSCDTIYENIYLRVCAVLSEEVGLFSAPMYDIYATNLNTGHKSYISLELSKNKVSEIIKVNELEYFYKAYIGGNSPPSEHRHVLLLIDDGKVRNAGEFSGYEDIDGDQQKDYFMLKMSKEGKAAAFNKYSRVKLIIRDGNLIPAN